MKYKGKFIAQTSPVGSDGVADTHQDKIHPIPLEVLKTSKLYAKGRYGVFGDSFVVIYSRRIMVL